MSEKHVMTLPQARDASGRLLASDGLPAHGHARAAALAKAGKTKDPLGLVSDALIRLHAPAGKPAGNKKEEK